MAQDWDIKPLSDRCSRCETAFEDKQHYHSALVFGEESGYRRIDCCDHCWPLPDDEAMPYSAWEGVFRVPPPPPEEPLKKETAESLLRHLIEEEDESHAPVIFILAVMLERKKLLIEQTVRQEDDALIRVYEHRKTHETFIVPDPRLRLSELETVQQQVIDMLGGSREKASDNGSHQEGEVAQDGQAMAPSEGVRDGFSSRPAADGNPEDS